MWFILLVVCSSVTQALNGTQNKLCTTREFHCSGQCLDVTRKCDGITDCEDGADEINCYGFSRRSRRAGSCILPPIPDHGTYISNVPSGTPGQSYLTVHVNYTCHPGYGLVGGSLIYCYDGYWTGHAPNCVRFCKLDKHPSVQYYCSSPGSTREETLCNDFEPSGTIVRPECNSPNYYSSEVLPFMRCIEGDWDYIAKCSPECGKITPGGAQLLTGGQLVKKGEFPWHAGIYKKTFTPYQQICGGSLISNTVIISAAHCFYDSRLEPASNFAAAVGKLYRPYNDQVDDSSGAQKSDVKEIKIPTRFRGRTANFQDDIALVIVSKEFEYHTFVRPVCLDFHINFNRLQLLPGKMGKVAGWGLTGINGEPSPFLKVLELPIADIDYCISKAPPGFAEYITGDKICAGYENAGSAVCQGDSGGGLVFPERERGVDRYYLRGIVSTAPDDDNLCNAQALTAFTQVLSHEHFIKEYFYTYTTTTITHVSTCRENQWKCFDGSCIPQYRYCDGLQDCPDNSDESAPECRRSQVTPTPQPIPLAVNTSEAAQIECGVIAAGNENFPSIPNGHVYMKGAVPWLAAIYKKHDRFRDLQFNCGGTLISNIHVITVGHCLERRQNSPSIKDFVVALGVYDLNNWGDEDIVTRPIASAFIHQDFNATTLANDIAVLKLGKTVEFNMYIRPVCLWSGPIDLSLIVGASGVAAGWAVRGLTGTELIDKPGMVRMPIVSTATCRASHAAFRQLTSSRTLCAGDRKGAGVCPGDSGIGLVILDKGRFTLRGVASVTLRPKENEICNLDEYTIFTDIVQFLPWIRDLTGLPIPQDVNTSEVAQIECGVIADEIEDSYGFSFVKGAVPWLAAIYKKHDRFRDLHFNCGGTLISNIHVITAAHCFERRKYSPSIEDFVVALGVYELNNWGDNDIVTRSIASAFIHKDYNPTTIANDIAVLALGKTVEFNMYIRPVCLWSGPTDLNLIVGASGVAAGWVVRGTTSAEGINKPGMIRMPIVSTATCRASHAAFHQLTSSRTLCAGDRNGSGVCTGGSGIGLVILDSGRLKLRGVASVTLRPKENESCNLDEYTLFTDVAQFLPWIRDVTR